MLRRRWICSVLVVLLAFVCAAMPAATAIGNEGWTLAEFPLPGDAAWPQALAADSSGNLWFVEVGRDQVGRLIAAQATPGTTQGFSEFALTLGAWPQGIAAASDGSVWFGEMLSDALGSVGPTGTITEYQVLQAGAGPIDVATSSDGAIWFVEGEGNTLGRFWPLTMTVELYPLPLADGYPVAVTIDSSGNVWFAAAAADQIGVYHPREMTMTLYAVPDGSFPTSLVVDAGVVWFTEGLGNALGRLDPASGHVDEFVLPTANASPKGLALDGRGRLWLAESMADKIAMFDPATQAFTEYALAAGAAPEDVVVLGGDEVWFTQGGGNSLGRLTLQAQPTSTPTQTGTSTRTVTPTPTATRSATPTASATPSPTATRTASGVRRIFLPVIVGG